MFSQESILPFVTFIQGCDFHESETISDRVIMVFKGLKRNTINLNKDILTQEKCIKHEDLSVFKNKGLQQ